MTGKFCDQCGKTVESGATFCIHCGVKLAGDKIPPPFDLREKRERVMGKPPLNPLQRMIPYALAAFPVLGAFLIFRDKETFKVNPILQSQPVIASAAAFPPVDKTMEPIEVKVEAGKIIVSLEQVLEKKFVAFDYKQSDKTIPLLAYISGEGKLITAVSMCEPCNSIRFRINGSNLVCDSCGTTWELDNLNGRIGACQTYPPDPIPSIIVGDEIQIEESVVSSWVPRI